MEETYKEEFWPFDDTYVGQFYSQIVESQRWSCYVPTFQVKIPKREIFPIQLHRIKESVPTVVIKRPVKKVSTKSRWCRVDNQKWESLILALFASNHKCIVLNDKSFKSIYTNQFAKLESCCGQMFALTYMKHARQAVYKFVSDDPIIKGTIVKLTKDGIPVFLQGYIPLLRKKSKPHTQVVLSMLQIGRLYSNVGELDTSNVTDPYTGSDDTVVVTREHIGSFVRSYKLTLDDETKGNLKDSITYHMRSSTGPCGPAMSSVIEESKAIPNGVLLILKNRLPTDIFESLMECRGLSETDYPPDLRACLAKDRQLTFQKLTVVEDKEGKDRVIAILNYWVQMALKPLHKVLMKLLHKFSQDATFDQHRLSQEFALQEGPFYSLDLKAATDRMPATLMKRLLGVILGDEDKASDYMYLLQGEPFSVENGEFVSYAVGQPMGAYASWALLALTHHLIVYTAVVKTSLQQVVPVEWDPRKNYRDNFNSLNKSYMLLGDDLVIKGSALSESYKSTVQQLGMEISPLKTIKSKDSFEFAKRFYVGTEEWSPIPIGHLKHSDKNYWDIVGFIEKCESRRFSFDNLETREILCDVLFAKYSSRQKRYLKNLVHRFYHNIDPYKDGWDVDLRWKLTKWVKPDTFNFGCTTSDEQIINYLIILFQFLSERFIMKNITLLAQSYNDYAKSDWYREWSKLNEREVRFKNEVYLEKPKHPMIKILHSIISSNINSITFKAPSATQSDNVARVMEKHRQKVKLADFVFLQPDITKVTSMSGHSKFQRVRAYLSNELIDTVIQLDQYKRRASQEEGITQKEFAEFHTKQVETVTYDCYWPYS